MTPNPVNGLDYLLTWNCKHIANAKMRDKVGEVVGSKDTSPSSFARLRNCSRTDAMREDPVVEAVRKVREAHAAQFDYDLQAIYRAAKEEEAEEEAQSGHKFVRLP